MSDKHTATPWRAREMGSEGGVIFPDSGDKREDLKHIAVVNGRDTLTDFANAKFIVDAANRIDEAVEIFQRIQKYIELKIEENNGCAWIDNCGDAECIFCEGEWPIIDDDDLKSGTDGWNGHPECPFDSCISNSIKDFLTRIQEAKDGK